MKRLFLIALLASGCGNADTLVVVTVDAQPMLDAVARLHVRATTAGNKMMEFDFSPANQMPFSIPPKRSFALEVASSYSGNFTVEVAAQDASGDLASGSGSTTLSPGARRDLPITLGPGGLPDLALEPDLSTDDGGDDGGGVDAAIGPDMAVPPKTIGFAATGIATTLGLAGCRVADLNRDRKLDLVCAAGSINQGAVSISIGDGAGGFQAPTTINTISATNGYVGSLAVADLNRDGKLDIVASHGDNQRQLAVMLGNGDGTFASPQPSVLMSGGNPCPCSDVHAADLNRDGKPDLVFGGNGAYFSTGNGDGTFQSPVTQLAPIGVGPYTALADLDNNDTLDIVVGHQGSNQFHSFLNSGSGTFTSPPPTTATAADGPSTIADFNRDGNPDLVIANDSAAALMFLGNGNGTFQAPTTVMLGAQAGLSRFHADDFDGDGILDLAFRAFVTGTQIIQVMRGVGDGSFVSPGVRINDAYLELVADFDRDGKPDLLAQQGALLKVFLNANPGLPARTLSFAAPSPYATNVSPYTVVIAELNHDGKLDVAVANADSHDYSSLLGNGDGTLQAALSSPLVNLSYNFELFDVDRDGRLDAITHAGFGNTMVSYGDGMGRFPSPSPYPGFTMGSPQVSAGDLNRDGRPDLVIQTNTTMEVLLATGTRTFAGSTTPYSIGSGMFANRPVVADYNRDGALDVVTSLSDPGTAIKLWLNAGNGTFGSASNVSTGYIGALADVDRNGTVDFVVIGNSIATVPGVGDGSFGTARTSAVGGFTLALADFDVDGKLDLVALFATGLRIARGLGDGTFGAPLVISSNEPAAVAVGDLNRDGLPDIAFTHPTGNNVYVLLNTSR